MASPFAYFRKHTALFTAVLGVMLMMAFVVADPLMQYLGSANAGGAARDRRNDVAVSWDGGRLTEGELSMLVARRQVLAGFIRAVYEQGTIAAMQAGVPSNLPTSVAPLSLPTRPEQGVEEDVVRQRLLAQAARDAGMVITDETITDYLVALGRDYVTKDQMRQLISSIRLDSRNRATIDFVFELMREALLARSYLASYQYTLTTQLPQERWADWLKANDRVIVEAAAVPASEFLGDVEEPTEAQLRAYYEEYKDDVPEPVFVQNTELPSPDPAFGVPRRAALQYLKAEFEPLVQQQLETITEEEVKEFYEQNKEMFVDADTDLLDQSDLMGDEATGDLGLELDLPTSDQPAEEGAVAPEDEPTAGPNATETPAADDGEASTPDDDAPEATPPETESEQPGGGSSDEPQAGANESSRARPASPFRLVAMQQDTPDPETPVADQDDASDGISAAETGSSVPDTPEQPAADEAGDGEQPTSEGAPTGDAPIADDPSATSDDGVLPGEGGEAATAAPLEEVRDEVRQRLAEVKAAGQINNKFTEIEAKLGSAFADHFDAMWAARDAKREEPAPPEELINLEPIAKQYGLEYGKTEALSLVQMRDSQIGQAYYRDPSATEGIPVWVQAFRTNSKDVYEPFQAYDGELNRYIVMVTERLPANTPEFDEIRDEVARAWKIKKAGELALARAKALAERASQSGESLSELLEDDSNLEAFRTDPFSWLQFGSVNRVGYVTLRLGDPAPVEAAGPDFMETVFGLSVGEVAGAPNHDRSVAYVVRLAERLSTEAELRQQFLQEWDRWYGVQSLRAEHLQSVFDDIYKHLVGKDGLDWKRTPDRTDEELMAEGEA